MSLKSFLMDSRNSRSRERLYFHKLYFDLKLAAARAGYALLFYEPDVDREGFDIVLDDQDSQKHLQIKSYMKSGSTSTWDVHKRILRPTPFNCEKLGFEPSPFGTGTEGGIVLIEIDDSDNCDTVKYRYTDILIIKALESGLVSRNESTKKQSENLIKDLRDGVGTDKVKLGKNLFLYADSAGHLLAMIGLHSEEDHSWRDNFLTALKGGFDPTDIGSVEKTNGVNAENAADGLLKLVSDKLNRFSAN